MTRSRFFVAMVLALLCANYCFAREWPEPPPGQPTQIESRIKYDRTLSDPFFKSEKWTFPRWTTEDVDGRIVYTGDTQRGRAGNKESSRLEKKTARCLSSLEFGHTIDFCRAKLLDIDTMKLLFRDDSSPLYQYLQMVIHKGVFSSQFWAYYKVRFMTDLKWTTTKQELTLDKHVYLKDDVIKGRIDIEVVDELINPEFPDRPPRPITFRGVFKTIVE